MKAAACYNNKDTLTQRFLIIYSPLFLFCSVDQFTTNLRWSKDDVSFLCKTFLLHILVEVLGHDGSRDGKG
jgi:hypothetical protein